MKNEEMMGGFLEKWAGTLVPQASGSCATREKGTRGGNAS